MALPNPKAKYCLQVDASQYALGAVLSQVQHKAEKILDYFSLKLHDAETRYPVHDRTIGHLRRNIILEIQSTWTRATIFGTHRPCDLALDSHTTTPHCTTDGHSDNPPEFGLGGQANPGCKESGRGHVISLSGFPTGAMQRDGTRSYCGGRMNWGYQGGHNWRWMVQAYCTFLGQPNSPPPAMDCIRNR